MKPALIEITTNTTEVVDVEIRASLEALLTGINGRYRNTTQAPNADEYDRFRAMESQTLREAFRDFEPTLLAGVELSLDGVPAKLSIKHISVPEPGYTKVPRNSVITLTGHIPRQTKSLTWYYSAGFGDHATRVRQVDPDNKKYHWSSHQWIKDDQPTKPFELNEVFSKPSIAEVIKTYTVSGFEHILPLGLDHILFVLGIFLLSRHLKPIVLQVSMFTLAHSITLALGMYGWVEVPARIVEPLIALSITFVAIENVFFHKINPWRLPVVFGFGLLHGLGFASVLNDFGMPTDAFLTALLAFNVGVELGQLTVVLAAFLGVAYWFKSELRYRQIVVIPASLVIGLVSLYWFFDRLELF